MYKLLPASNAQAAFTRWAFAAAPPARTYTKAPPPIVAPSWTGFYIFGGVTGGIFEAAPFTSVTATGVPLSIHQRMGGDGWLGTVGAGYDWQVNHSWVVGVFGD